MGALRTIAAFIISATVTAVASTGFYTQQIIARQSSIGAEYAPSQIFDAFLLNLQGFTIGSTPSLGMIVAIGLGVAFAIAAVVKRFIRPLAGVAYPVAGAAALALIVYLIEQQLGGGAGVLGGARGPVGTALQALAGGLGGAAFAFLRPR